MRSGAAPPTGCAALHSCRGTLRPRQRTRGGCCVGMPRGGRVQCVLFRKMRMAVCRIPSLSLPKDHARSCLVDRGRHASAHYDKPNRGTGGNGTRNLCSLCFLCVRPFFSGSSWILLHAAHPPVASSPRATPCPARPPWRGARSFPKAVGNGRRMKARQGAIRIFSGTPWSSPAPASRHPASPDARSREPSNLTTAAGTRRHLARRDF
jgi:hypothetical protein